MIRYVLAFVLVLATALPATADVRQVNPDAPRWGVVPGVVIVQLKETAEPRANRAASDAVSTGFPVLDRVAADMRARRFDRVFETARRPALGSQLSDLTRFYRLEFDVVRDPQQVAEEIAADPNVALAEVVTWHAVDQFIPNDPSFDDQWHHMEGPQPTQDNDIDSPEAWAVQTGDPDVKIAIFDTGVLWYHPDLRNQIWVNPGEDLDGDGVVMDADDMNGIDDDLNGFIDDVIGWDFVAGGSGCAIGEDCTVADNDPRDFDGHGTATSGCAASATHNGRDGAGVAGGWHPLQRGCVIMPCRSGWATSSGLGAVRTDYVGQGVDYASANGALVGNLSAGAGASSVLAAALNNAFANGFIFVKSAGNDNNNVADSFDDYFSTVAVASTTTSDTKSGFSTFGVWVDISAPGSGIWTTDGAGGVPSFASVNGTSFSAPIVAGCAALLYANNPTFTKLQIENTLYNTADSIDHLNPGYENMLGAGRVNVGSAIASLPQAAFGAVGSIPALARSINAATATSSLAPDTPLVGHVPMTVDFTDLSPGPPTAWNWKFGDGGSSTEQNPQYTFNIPGVYDVTLDATHAGGEGRKRHQNAVLVHADTGFYANGQNCPGNMRKAMAELHMTNAIDLHALVLPLTYQGPGDMTLDSFSFAGTRLEYFEQLDRPFSSSNNKFSVFDLEADVGGGSPPLAPGTGPILKMYFTIESTTPVDSITLSPVDTFTVLNFDYHAVGKNNIEYVPGWVTGGVNLLPYCRGDFDINGATTSSDIIQLVNYVFKSGPISPDPWVMDVNVDGTVTSADIIVLVDYVFKGGSPPE
jgi:subtilisin family serine protease